ncbi:MAG: hypothetical protein ACI8QT_001685, partial [Halioglobus sp.]
AVGDFAASLSKQVAVGDFDNTLTTL